MASSSETGKVFDSQHSDDSISDIDISALLNHLDQRLYSPPVDSARTAEAGGSGQASGGPGGRGSDGLVSQNDINQIILVQRLDCLENNFVKILHKKTNDVSTVKNFANKSKHSKAQPTHHGFDTDVTSASGPVHAIPLPDRLCEEPRIQAEVQNILRQVADNAKPGTEKIKSQRFFICSCEQ